MKTLISLFTACMVVVGITSCDVAGEQNYEYTPGDSLLIVGPVAFATTTPLDPISVRIDNADYSRAPVDTVLVGDTTTFYLQAFTTLKDYNWTVNGNQPYQVRRNEGFADVIFDEAGLYEIRVEDGEYVGTVQVTAIDTSTTP